MFDANHIVTKVKKVIKKNRFGKNMWHNVKQSTASTWYLSVLVYCTWKWFPWFSCSTKSKYNHKRPLVTLVIVRRLSGVAL